MGCTVYNNIENLLTKVVLCLHLPSDISVTGLTVPTVATIHKLDTFCTRNREKSGKTSKNHAARKTPLYSQNVHKVLSEIFEFIDWYYLR